MALAFEKKDFRWAEAPGGTLSRRRGRHSRHALVGGIDQNQLLAFTARLRKRKMIAKAQILLKPAETKTILYGACKTIRTK
jgi:hypothetical protein